MGEGREESRISRTTTGGGWSSMRWTTRTWSTRPRPRSVLGTAAAETLPRTCSIIAAADCCNALFVCGLGGEDARRVWSAEVEVALPCATQNELDEADAQLLVCNGVIAVAGARTGACLTGS
eukprot:1355178-Rhodomonas_salina.4